MADVPPLALYQFQAQLLAGTTDTIYEETTADVDGVDFTGSTGNLTINLGAASVVTLFRPSRLEA